MPNITDHEWNRFLREWAVATGYQAPVSRSAKFSRWAKYLAMACLCVVLTGCSSTVIDLGEIGTYRSTRDTQLDELHLRVTKPDGSVFEVDVNGASGDASSVINSQTELLQAAIQAAFQAGLRSR